MARWIPKQQQAQPGRPPISISLPTSSAPRSRAGCRPTFSTSSRHWSGSRPQPQPSRSSVTSTFADAADTEDVPRSGRRTPPRAMSIGAEVALATLASPHAGEQRVLLSRRLRDDLPQTLTALARGELTEDRAFAVAREVAHLTPEQRRSVDDDLAPRLPGLGDLRLRQVVRRSCLAIAADAETRRYRRARADRRVTTRHLDDGTGQLTATLPLEVLAAVRAALDAAAAAARSRRVTPHRRPGPRRHPRRPHHRHRHRRDVAPRAGQPRHRRRVAPRRRHRTRPRPRSRLPPGRLVHRPGPPSQRRGEGHPAATVRRTRAPGTRRDGIHQPPLRRAPGRVPRPPRRRRLPHPGVQCPDPAPRPHPASEGARPNDGRQRPRTLRTLQLRQGDPRLDLLGPRPPPGRTTRGPRSDGAPPHPSVHRPTATRAVPPAGSTTRPTSSASPAASPWLPSCRRPAARTAPGSATATSRPGGRAARCARTRPPWTCAST